MKNQSFKQWIIKQEALLPPDAVPPAMVQKAPEHDLVRQLKGLPALKKTDSMQSYMGKIQEVLQKLDKLAQLTHDNPIVWTQLHAAQPNLKGITHQEALETFKDEFQSITNNILSNPEKHGAEYRALMSKPKNELQEDEFEKLLAYTVLFRLTSQINMELRDLDKENIVNTLNQLDYFINKSPTGYQKSIGSVRPILR